MYHEELRGELYPRSGIEGGGHSLRVHELYQKFLAVVKANLEGMVPPPIPTIRTITKVVICNSLYPIQVPIRP